MNYEKLINLAYSKYLKDWCDTRGYKLSELDPENGINGEYFACLSEFETNEFQDEEYMRDLLSHEEFVIWCGRDKLKEPIAEHRIKMRYAEQMAGKITDCPRCGEKMNKKRSRNALSRRIEVYICSTCGIAEALEDAPFEKLSKVPIIDWEISKIK